MQRPLSAHTPILFVTAYAVRDPVEPGLCARRRRLHPSPVEPAILQREGRRLRRPVPEARSKYRRQAEQLREAEERLRHQAESALRESEDRFRVLCTSAPVGDLPARRHGPLRLREPALGAHDRPGRRRRSSGSDGPKSSVRAAASTLLASWREALHEGRGWSHEEAIHAPTRRAEALALREGPVRSSPSMANRSGTSAPSKTSRPASRPRSNCSTPTAGRTSSSRCSPTSCATRWPPSATRSLVARIAQPRARAGVEHGRDQPPGRPALES